MSLAQKDIKYDSFCYFRTSEACLVPCHTIKFFESGDRNSLSKYTYTYVYKKDFYGADKSICL